MSNLGNKEIMAKNIKYYMSKHNITAKELCKILKVPESTFCYWTTAKSYPRIDKIEMMANYFGIKKSDLVEERVEKEPPSEKEVLIAQLMEHFKNLSPDQLKQVIQYARFLQQTQEADAENHK